MVLRGGRSSRHPLQDVMNAAFDELRTMYATIGNGVYLAISLQSGAGRGLFTSKAYSKNALLTFMEGILLDYAVARVLAAQSASNASHFYGLCKQFLVLDGDRQGNLGTGGASFANDNGKHANASLHIRWYKGVPICFVKLMRAFAAHEEVYVKYGRTYWDRSEVGIEA